MYCIILHTLSPRYSNRLFQTVLACAQSVQSGTTMAFKDPTGEAGR